MSKKKVKPSLNSELDNVSADSTESTEDVVHSFEDALETEKSPFSYASSSEPLTEDEVAKLNNDLKSIEEDIVTLKQVLQTRLQYSSELKRRLGLSVWSELSEDMSKSLQNIKNSQAFQKTETFVKETGKDISRSIDKFRQSATVKSLEQKVETVYSEVKAKFPKTLNNSSNGSSKHDEQPILDNHEN